MDTTDILLNATGDLMIKDGDFVMGDSEQQHVEHLLLTSEGTWVDSPLIGIGIVKYINAPVGLQLKNKIKGDIKLNLEMDGYTQSTVSLEIQSGQLQNVKVDGTRV